MAGLCEGGNEPTGSLKANNCHNPSDPRNYAVKLTGFLEFGKDAATLPPRGFDEYLSILLNEEEEKILRNMLLELNYNCEQYGMKMNANKTKIMVVTRKIKKVTLRILNEAVEQVNSFKYLGCTISSNMLSQEIKRRIAMAKEAFNRKRRLFCGSLEKELRKRLTLRRNEEKRIEAFEMWIWRRLEHVKWTDRIRNEVVLESVGEERMMLKLVRKRKRNWLGHWLRRNCLLKDALEGMVNERRVWGRRRYQIR
ncbi:hypothetical protein ANN_25157 [Periplaneta americana]|uniref:Reverse transcriptase domain-containing protein n=1 Tax=Periplaneta americana TaxID=6978 RepID=A0ABQ8S0J9_PERAM|nr:hypothetical protein ANN_25157 [Periplaneta americana]